MFNKLVSTSVRLVASQAAFNLGLRLFSPGLTKWLQSTVLPWCKDTLYWGLKVITPVLPSTWVPLVSSWVKHAVREVEEHWPDEEKVRFILRLAHDGKLAGIKGWAMDELEALGKKGWCELRQNVPIEVLELINAARKAMAIDLVKDAAAAIGVTKLSASVISAKIDRAVAHEKEKTSAAAISDMIAESKAKLDIFVSRKAAIN